MLNYKNHCNLQALNHTKLATVDLSDCARDGRDIIARCTNSAREAGVSKAAIDRFIVEAFQCDFNGLLRLVLRKFDVVMVE
ncbi:hypothetical protein ROA7450_03989 [Roseovarius albus]|uniref:Uncharacterized protein n=1 Tax=Roseovarius albus TaxID=1247867 RepID=A0A1X7A728_9RHOB|nr:hypothetical protein ROA7450_03989 [Roseovarius albus]